MDWYPIDEPPDPTATVLLYVPSRPMRQYALGFYWDGQWYDWADGLSVKVTPTYWAALPDWLHRFGAPRRCPAG